MAGGLMVTDWTSIGDSLVAHGSVRIPAALEPELTQHLISAQQPPWHVLPPEEGVVKQIGFGSGMTVAQAQPAVRQVGAEIVRELTSTASTDLPAIAEFNEVTWTRYPANTGHITAHRDPSAYGGIIAIATLLGRATFRVWDGAVLGTPEHVLESGSTPNEWDAAPGDLILLRGNGWPTPNARCPMHEAQPPPASERIILTFRYNTRGPGGGYNVEDP